MDIADRCSLARSVGAVWQLENVYSRFRRWQEAGIWDQILTKLERDGAHNDQFDGAVTMIDSTNIRAHQHAVGARKTGSEPTTTVSAAAEAAAAASYI